MLCVLTVSIYLASDDCCACHINAMCADYVNKPIVMCADGVNTHTFGWMSHKCYVCFVYKPIVMCADEVNTHIFGWMLWMWHKCYVCYVCWQCQYTSCVGWQCQQLLCVLTVLTYIALDECCECHINAMRSDSANISNFDWQLYKLHTVMCADNMPSFVCLLCTIWQCQYTYPRMTAVPLR